ncbi:MAG: oligoendopeptidase F [bacterium]
MSTSELAPQAVPERDRIPAERRWELGHIFETREAWEAELNRVASLLEPMLARKGSIAGGPGNLAEVLSLQSEIGSGLDRVYVYAHLLRDQDTRATDAQGMAERAAGLGTKVAEVTAWVEPEILALPAETLRAWTEAPELADRRHWLDDLVRVKEHTLSPREEEILAMAGEVTRTPRTVYGMLNDADLEFRAVRDEEGREVELTKGRYSKFMESPDRRVRRDAWDSLTEGYEKHRNTVASLLAGSVKRDIFYSRVRGYPSSLAAALFPKRISEDVYRGLVRTIDERKAVVHRYVALRKRLLALEDLQVYDLYVPLASGPARQFEWEEACALLEEGLTPLGGEYVEALRGGLEGRWIDVHETRGKRSGAYSWGAYSTHPYVLMNYQGTLDHLFTLAHEMGHAMHSYYSNLRQPYWYSHYPIFLAEVASTTNEAILMDHLLATTKDPGFRLALLNQYVDQIRGTVITQVMFAEFELRLHEMAERGEPLTSDSISEVYGEIYRRILGPELGFDERAGLGWARIPHFYTAYYVYQYATGYSAATALSRRILAGGDKERDDYLGFLAAGDSDYPLEILKRAGVDLETNAPVRDTLDLFESLLGQIEAHVAEHGLAATTNGQEGTRR